jgi:hypothetical protein
MYGMEQYNTDLSQDVRDIVKAPTERMQRIAARSLENWNVGDWNVSMLYGFQSADNYYFRTAFNELIYIKLFIAHDSHTRQLHYYAHTMSANSVNFDIIFEADMDVNHQNSGTNTNASLTINAIARPRATATVVHVHRVVTGSFLI